MTRNGVIELKDLVLKTDIGTYGPGDQVPDHHVLDLKLHIPPSKILIPADDMAHVFDYDPLIAEIKTLALSGHRETQEWLMTQIAQLCATYAEIKAVEIYLRKFPAADGTGTLGVRLTVDHDDFEHLRMSH